MLRKMFVWTIGGRRKKIKVQHINTVFFGQVIWICVDQTREEGEEGVQI